MAQSDNSNVIPFASVISTHQNLSPFHFVSPNEIVGVDFAIFGYFGMGSFQIMILVVLNDCALLKLLFALYSWQR